MKSLARGVVSALAVQARSERDRAPSVIEFMAVAQMLE
jgi:hypothetical protein